MDKNKSQLKTGVILNYFIVRKLDPCFLYACNVAIVGTK